MEIQSLTDELCPKAKDNIYVQTPIAIVIGHLDLTYLHRTVFEEQSVFLTTVQMFRGNPFVNGFALS